MWVSTVTIGSTFINAPNKRELFDAVDRKLNQLRPGDGPFTDGHTIDGSDPMGFPNNPVPPGTSEIVIQRFWASEATAREYVDFINSFHESLTANLEEQV